MKRWATFLLIVLTLAIASNGFGQTALKSFTGLQGRELRLYVTNAIDSLTATQTGSCGSFYLYVLGDTVMFAQLADSAKRIDTTYAPFQSYVFNHAGAGAGDIDAVIAGDGMTGGATSGNATLNIVGRFGIISGADSLILDTAGIRTWLTTLADATASDSFHVSYDTWGGEGWLFTGDTLFIDTTGGSGEASDWTASAATLTSDSDKVTVPVYLKVGRRPDDPFPTYSKALLSADSVGSDSHYVVTSSWLSVPIATTTLQHALAGEIYYTAETGTQANSLVGQELSVNVPGRLVFNRATGGYGIYGLIVNGKPTTTNANGYMEGSRFTGIFIDLADVSAGAQQDSVRFDTTRGIWIPRLDGGLDDSGFVKYSFWGMNNTYVDDTSIVRDQIIIGANATDTGWPNANLAWIGLDTIRGITTWTTEGVVVPVINSRGNTSETGLLRLYGDSSQVRILHTVGATYMQFGDSAFTASDSVYITGYNSTNLDKFEVRADQFRYRGANDIIVVMPNDTPTVGQVMKVTDLTGTTATVEFEDDGGSGSGSSDSLYINDGSTQYSILNNLLKLKEGVAVDLTREDSTAYDVLKVNVDTAAVALAEAIADRVGGMVTGNTETGITVAYQDADNTLDFTISETGDIEGVTAGTGLTGGGTSGSITINFGATGMIIAGADTVALDTTALRTWAVSLIVDSANGGAARAEIADSLTDSDEKIADKSGAMVTGNTETGITVTYQDADNTMDYVVALGTTIESGEVTANTIDTSDMAHAPLGKLIYDSVAARGFLTTETGDISSVVAGSGMTGGATSGDATLNAIGKIYILAGADSLALDTAGLRTWAASLIVDSANGGAARAELADSTTGGAARAELADSTTGGAARAELADSAIGSTRATSLLGDLDPDQLTGDATNNDLVDSAIVGGVSLAKIGSGGASSGYIAKFLGGVWTATPESSQVNPTISGDLNIRGNIRLLNNRSMIDTLGLYVPRASTYITMKSPAGLLGYADSAQLHGMHPDIVYIPGGWNGWNRWGVFSIGDDSREDIFLRVSNDGQNWYRYGVGADSVPDPLFMEDSCECNSTTAEHLSDPDLVFGADGKLYVICRATIVAAGCGQSFMARSTSNGVDWSPIKLAYHETPSGAAQLLSPSIWLDTSGTYKIWMVRYKEAATNFPIVLYEAVNPESTWTYVDSVKQTGTSTYWTSTGNMVSLAADDTVRSGSKGTIKPWHVNVIEHGADEKFVLLTATDSLAESRFHFVVGTTQTGRDFDVASQILTHNAHDGTDSTWDEWYWYRGGGFFVNDAVGERFELYYSGRRSINSADSMGSNWNVGRTYLYFDAFPCVMEGVSVHGRTTPPTGDSVVLTFPQDGSWLFMDSSYDNSKNVVDSARVDVTLTDRWLVMDSLVFTYDGQQATDDSCEIDYIELRGPDRSNGTNMADSVWYSSETDRYSTTTTRVAYALNKDNKPQGLIRGDRFQVYFKMKLFDNSDDPWIRVGAVQLIGRSR